MTFETKLNACVSLTETHFLLMLKKLYMYSVLNMCVKYILKTEELQSQLLD